MVGLERVDPYTSFNFLVEIGERTVGGFSEVTGLVVETELEEYREGGMNDYVHKLPRIIRYPNLTLRRGIADVDDLYRWYQKVVKNVVAGS